MEVLQAIGWLLTSGWNLLAGIKVPGFGFSFATLFVGLFLAGLGLRFLSMILGVGIGREDIVRGEEAGLLERKDKPRKIGF